MWDFISSMFGDMFGSGEGAEAVGAGEGAKKSGLLGEDGSMMKGVKTALMIAGGHGQAHSNVQAAPFHYQSNANLDTTLNHEANYMKNDINVGQGFNSLKGLF